MDWAHEQHFHKHCKEAHLNVSVLQSILKLMLVSCLGHHNMSTVIEVTFCGQIDCLFAGF